jgi:isopenicillin-N N-acyltransferase-like protein
MTTAKRLFLIAFYLLTMSIATQWPYSVKGGGMDLIELSGTYFEIGEQWGNAFGSDINASMYAEINGLGQFFNVEKTQLVSMASRFLPKAREYDPEFIEVLSGFATGADIPFEEVFALRSLLELTFFMQKIPAMCTAVAVTGSATTGNQTIIGQNIDWHPGIPVKLFQIKWPNGVCQLSLSLGGIWEYSLSSHPDYSPFGITATATVAYKENQDINKPTLSMVMSKAGRQKRLDGALSIFINAKKDLASFLIASGDGDMLGFECVAGDMEVLHPELNGLIHTNHYLTERFKPYEFFTAYVPGSYLRYARLKQLVQAHYGQITPRMMMTFLSNHKGFPKSICTHVDPDSNLPPSVTLASIVMIPEEKTMYVACGNPCETDYLEYTID